MEKETSYSISLEIRVIIASILFITFLSKATSLAYADNRRSSHPIINSVANDNLHSGPSKIDGQTILFDGDLGVRWFAPITIHNPHADDHHTEIGANCECQSQIAPNKVVFDGVKRCIITVLGKIIRTKRDGNIN